MITWRLPWQESIFSSRILEGVHFLLSEALIREELSGKSECLRVHLLTQIENLCHAYPELNFGPKNISLRHLSSVTSASFTCANVDKRHEFLSEMVPAISSTLSTESGSSCANYSTSYSNSNDSSGYSGDGIVAATSPSSTREIYEELTTSEVGDSNSVLSQRDCICESVDGSDDDDKLSSYCTSVKSVPFRVIIAKCDKFGYLKKRTKKLLPNAKTYLCVLADRYLYLYLKDSNDRQKKTIDVSCLQVCSACQGDIKEPKRRELTFKLFADGRKSHMFEANKKKDKEEWMLKLRHAIKRCQNGRSGFIFPVVRAIPSLPPPLPVSTDHLGRLAKVKPAVVNSEKDESDCEEDDEETENSAGLYEELTTIAEKIPEPVSLESHAQMFRNLPLHVADFLGIPSSSSENYSVVSEEKMEAGSKQTKACEGKLEPPISLQDSSSSIPDVPVLPLDCEMSPKAHYLHSIQKEFFHLEDAGIYCEIDEATQGLLQGGAGSPAVDELQVTSCGNSAAPPLPAREPFCQGAKQDTEGSEYDWETYDVPASSNKISDDGVGLLSMISLSSESKSETKVSGSTDENEYKVPNPVLQESVYQFPSSVPVSYANTVDSHSICHPNVGLVSSDSRLPSSRSVSCKDQKVTECNSLSEPQGSNLSKCQSSVRHIVAMIDQSKQWQLTDQKAKCALSLKQFGPLAINKVEESLNRCNLQNGQQKLCSQKTAEERNDSVSMCDATTVAHESTDIDMGSSNCSDTKCVTSPSVTVEESNNMEGTVYIAKFAYVASNGEELSFSRGDEITVLETPEGSQQWTAQLNNKTGLVRKWYLRKKDPVT